MIMDHVDIVTHVHWDREWYRSFDGFRSRLVELVDAVLDQLESGELATFLLDGQTSVVDDYLEVRPDAADRLASHVAAGRLRIGPWYVLADKTLVSGEALIRNLLVGSARAHALGGRTDVGYCPDMFGHPPELPMVLRGFGIGMALVWRGADPALPVFRWRSPDGSEVLTLRSRYYEPEILWEPAGAEGRLAVWIAARRQTQPGGPLLLLNGGDHLAPRELSTTLAGLHPTDGGLADAGTEVALRQTTLEAHLRDLPAADAPIVIGALRTPGREGAFLLAGTLSVRPRQKRANADAQALLETLVEPMVARAATTPEPTGAAQERATTPTLRALLATAWRHLLQGHPHDSVCGCGTDTVAVDTMRRYRSSLEVGEHVLARAARRLGLPVGPVPVPDPDTGWMVVLNAAGQSGGGVVDLAVDLPPGRVPSRVLLTDGQAIPFAGVHGEVSETLVTDIATLPVWPSTERHVLSVAIPTVPASGWTALRIELTDRAGGTEQVTTVLPSDDGAPSEEPGWRHDAGTAISGGHLEAEVARDGTLWLRDRRTGVELGGIGRLVDRGDRGDTYNYDPPQRDVAVVADLVQVRRRSSEVAQELEVTLAAELPRGLVDGRDGRSEVTTPLMATLTARLAVDADQLELTVRFATDAEDHRLRLHVPVPGTAAASSFVTDSGFTWQEHAIAGSDVPDLPEMPGSESDPLTQPTQRFVAAGEGATRVAILVHGHHEVAGVPTPGGTELVVTLHRAVGQLGHRDLRTRTMGAGPPVPTPDAQEHGEHLVRLAVRLGDDDAEVVAAAWRWRSPLRALQLAGPPAVPTASGVEVDGGQLSAWKPAADGDGWIVRVANPTSRPREVSARLPVDAMIVACRLDESAVDRAGSVDTDVERPGPTALPAGRPVTVVVAAGGLASWRVSPDRSG